MDILYSLSISSMVRPLTLPIDGRWYSTIQKNEFNESKIPVFDKRSDKRQTKSRILLIKQLIKTFCQKDVHCCSYKTEHLSLTNIMQVELSGAVVQSTLVLITKSHYCYNFASILH